MRSEGFEIRYPDGDYEIVVTQLHRVPGVGDVIRRKNRMWEVTRTDQGPPLLVHLELVDRRPQESKPSARRALVEDPGSA